jgi:hypothetical protein
VAIKNVWDRRHDITTGYRIVSEAPIMRHFTVVLEPIEPPVDDEGTVLDDTAGPSSVTSW